MLQLFLTLAMIHDFCTDVDVLFSADLRMVATPYVLNIFTSNAARHSFEETGHFIFSTLHSTVVFFSHDSCMQLIEICAVMKESGSTYGELAHLHNYRVQRLIFNRIIQGQKMWS